MSSWPLCFARGDALAAHPRHSGGTRVYLLFVVPRTGYLVAQQVVRRRIGRQRWHSPGSVGHVYTHVLPTTALWNSWLCFPLGGGGGHCFLLDALRLLRHVTAQRIACVKARVKLCLCGRGLKLGAWVGQWLQLALL